MGLFGNLCGVVGGCGELKIVGEVVGFHESLDGGDVIDTFSSTGGGIKDNFVFFHDLLFFVEF